jgi:hypothetical protein
MKSTSSWRSLNQSTFSLSGLALLNRSSLLRLVLDDDIAMRGDSFGQAFASVTDPEG